MRSHPRLAAAAALLAVLGATAVATAGPIDRFRLHRLQQPDINPPNQHLDLFVLPGRDQVFGAADEEMVAGKDTSDDTLAMKAGKKVAGKDHSMIWEAATVTVGKGKDAQTLVVSGFATNNWYDGQPYAEQVAILWAAPMKNDVAGKAAKAGTLVAPAPLVEQIDPDAKAGVAALTAALTSSDALAKLVGKRKDAILVGSAPNEMWKGADVAKLLAKWKLSFSVQGPIRAGKSSSLVWMLANVKATDAGGTTMTYRALFGVVDANWSDADAKAPDWQLVLAHFALVE